MPNKISNVPYDQIPHVVLNHPQTKPDHIVIMTHLFKVLKDETNIVYSNEKLSINCKIPLRTVERRISQLNKMGFIKCTGRGLNRRIDLGITLITTAQLAVVKSTTAKSDRTTAKSDIHNRHTGGDSKPYSNPYTKAERKKDFSNSSGPKTLKDICEKLKLPLAKSNPSC